MPYLSYSYNEPIISNEPWETCNYSEKIFLQPSKSLTTVNSDNVYYLDTLSFSWDYTEIYSIYDDEPVYSSYHSNCNYSFIYNLHSNMIFCMFSKCKSNCIHNTEFLKYTIKIQYYGYNLIII